MQETQLDRVNPVWKAGEKPEIMFRESCLG